MTHHLFFFFFTNSEKQQEAIIPDNIIAQSFSMFSSNTINVFSQSVYALKLWVQVAPHKSSLLFSFTLG